MYYNQYLRGSTEFSITHHSHIRMMSDTGYELVLVRVFSITHYLHFLIIN